jgi:dolichol-phosphate mannosyltransferase
MNTPQVKTPIVTVVTPVFNEAENLPLFIDAVTRTLLSCSDCHFRVLFVDDGSRDESWRVISEICRRDPRFRGLRLSRNYGAHIALMAGIENARSEAVATLCCDLQDPPEVLLEFVKRWRAGARIVWGRRRTRVDRRWRILTSNLFAGLLRRYAMPRHSKFATGSFFLIDRQIVECFLQFREQHRVTFALVAWTGFDQDVVEYDRRPRRNGRSGWSLGRMTKTAYDTFISFSRLPSSLMTLLGIGTFLVNIPLGAYMVFGWLTGSPRAGWTSQMLAMLVFFGLQFLMMGLVGEYLHRIYTEVVRRPLYFLSEQTPPAEGEARHAA